MKTINEIIVNKVFSELKDWCHCSGYVHIVLAVSELLENDFKIPMMTVYDNVARQCGTTALAVEKDIRYVFKIDITTV